MAENSSRNPFTFMSKVYCFYRFIVFSSSRKICPAQGVKGEFSNASIQPNHTQVNDFLGKTKAPEISGA